MIAPFEPTIRALASRWAEAAILLPAFPLLARGRPLKIDEIAAASGATVETVTRALESGRCARDASGRLIDLYGLSLTPTPHRLEIDGSILFSCCALWAHVIPKLVDSTVRIESVDPLERQLVRLSVSPERVASIEPEGSAATLTTASQADLEADVCAAFCSQVRHFVSQESAENFADASSECHPVTLAELQEAAELLYQAIWSTVGA